MPEAGISKGFAGGDMPEASTRSGFEAIEGIFIYFGRRGLRPL